jgi:hypothetical protein
VPGWWSWCVVVPGWHVAASVGPGKALPFILQIVHVSVCTHLAGPHKHVGMMISCVVAGSLWVAGPLWCDSRECPVCLCRGMRCAANTHPVSCHTNCCTMHEFYADVSGMIGSLQAMKVREGMFVSSGACRQCATCSGCIDTLCTLSVIRCVLVYWLAAMERKPAGACGRCVGSSRRAAAYVVHDQVPAAHVVHVTSDWHVVCASAQAGRFAMKCSLLWHDLVYQLCVCWGWGWVGAKCPPKPSCMGCIAVVCTFVCLKVWRRRARWMVHTGMCLMSLGLKLQRLLGLEAQGRSFVCLLHHLPPKDCRVPVTCGVHTAKIHGDVGGCVCMLGVGGAADCGCNIKRVDIRLCVESSSHLITFLLVGYKLPDCERPWGKTLFKLIAAPLLWGAAVASMRAHDVQPACYSCC